MPGLPGPLTDGVPDLRRAGIRPAAGAGLRTMSNGQALGGRRTLQYCGGRCVDTGLGGLLLATCPATIRSGS
jgi:hypothetical protein